MNIEQRINGSFVLFAVRRPTHEVVDFPAGAGALYVVSQSLRYRHRFSTKSGDEGLKRHFAIIPKPSGRFPPIADIDAIGRTSDAGGMAYGRFWLALITFERRDEAQDILPAWAHGACGWMVAIAPDEDTARELLLRDLEHRGLRVLEVDNVREAFSHKDVEEVDDHLAWNLREIEPGKETVWGTIHGYKGEGQA